MVTNETWHEHGNETNHLMSLNKIGGMIPNVVGGKDRYSGAPIDSNWYCIIAPYKAKVV